MVPARYTRIVLQVLLAPNGRCGTRRTTPQSGTYFFRLVRLLLEPLRLDPEDDDLRALLLRPLREDDDFFDDDRLPLLRFLEDDDDRFVLRGRWLFVSPDCERCLLTVRAAISSARPSPTPRSSSESLMCSY